MIGIGAGGAMAGLWGKGPLVPPALGVRAGPALGSERAGSRVALTAQRLEEAHVPALGQRALEGHVLRLQEGVEAHQAQTDRALALGRVDRIGHLRRGALDE